MPRKIIPKKLQGFTLLEMVIALAIFAVIMIIVMGGLNMVVRSQEQVSARAKRLGELQMAVTVIVRDLTQIVPRPVRDLSGDVTNVVTVDPKNLIRLEFTSGGVINPNNLSQRSTLQRVGYGLDNSTLIRFTWPVLDRVSNTPMARRHILNEVVGFDVEYLNVRGEFVNDGTEAVALYIDIDLGKNGHYQRTFPLNGEVVSAPRLS